MRKEGKRASVGRGSVCVQSGIETEFEIQGDKVQRKKQKRGDVEDTRLEITNSVRNGRHQCGTFGECRKGKEHEERWRSGITHKCASIAGGGDDG